LSRAVAGVALVLCLVTTGCGGDDLSDRAADRLQEQVAAVGFAAAGGEYEAARQGLDRVRATTARLVERDEIDLGRAERIFGEIDRVEAALP
jgi:hypothetical protein